MAAENNPENAPLLSSVSSVRSNSPTAGLEEPGAHRNILVKAFVPNWTTFDTSRILRSYRPRSLFSIKPLEKFIEEREARPDGHKLAETLGVIDLLGYGVGSTVGAGIYSLIGVAAGIAGEGLY